ncbi:ABC-2 type transport system ATP-binding protein [Alkalispirochaeta americana]|uniref:ABC-2 type transport system ATP-binding protein n=1 Tax=Alkalispirochaeta americana TaxID=159291 RepID=A0A1N6SGP5_9SPIO|nr:ABC transporter ATP-binding protein [Alkalispirochaeta americana]SIQ40323.1 ABC-2 type transport system ATP-binding protein [Alkalispirochaeta americana]
MTGGTRWTLPFRDQASLAPCREGHGPEASLPGAVPPEAVPPETVPLEPAPLEMEGVRFAYSRKRPLFQDLDFTLPAGGVVGLLGRNGAGKTTLLKLGMGLLFPREGRVSLFGSPAGRRRPAILSRLVFIPEQIAPPPVTLVQYFHLQSGYYPAFDPARAETWAEQFEIPLDQALPSLSYGQQKKALLVTALACGPDLVILDEPTNGLDIPSKRVFRQLISQATQEGCSVVVSTHQVQDVAKLLDHVIILEGGKVLFQASRRTLLEELELRRFSSEEEARQAGALAWEVRFGVPVAVVPRDRTTPAGEELDLELLFHAAMTNPEALAAVCPGGDR